MTKQLEVRFTVSCTFDIDVTKEQWDTIEEEAGEFGEITNMSPAWGLIMDRVDLNDALDCLGEIEVDTYQYNED